MECKCPDANASNLEFFGVTEVILVRHGETSCNFDGIYQGQLDSELNELGWRQAKAVSDRLSRESKISALYSSDLKRAFDTATIIGQKCGLQVLTNPAWRERHLGKLEGLSWRKARFVEPEAFRAFRSKKHDKAIPGGGESWNQLYDRTTPALEEIANKHKGQKVVVVTHGGVLGTLWDFAGGKSSPGRVLNTSISIISKRENGEWFVYSWGDTSHLKEVDVPSSGLEGDKESG